MKTDVPLKRLTTLRPHDLLPLLGVPALSVEEVTVRELPFHQKRLDTLLRVRSPHGQEYLHLLEWQAYFDPAVLWRILTYLGLLGLTEPSITLVATVIYLKPSDDAGDTLTMAVDGVVQHQFQVRCIRLWEQDAHAAAASGNLALMVLSPLMRGADAALVEQTTRTLMQQVPPSQAADLLSILGIFAAPLIEPTRFVRLVTKEYLMQSDLIQYLVEDELAEREIKWKAELEAAQARLAAEQQARREAERQAEQARREAEQARREAERQAAQARLTTERETLAALVEARFPDAPLRLATMIQQIGDAEQLRALRLNLPSIADLATLEQQLRAAVHPR